MENNMKSVFDNPFFMLLYRVGDLIIANLLFLLSCLPVVTAGAAYAALVKISQDIVMETETGIFRSYFRAFRENFKQATMVWLWELLIIAAMVCYYLLIGYFFEGTTASVLHGILFVVAILALCVVAYLYPLLVRYTNTVKEHLRNAVILAVCKLPRTVAMAALLAFPFLILSVSVPVFIQTLLFWILIGFGFVCFLCSTLLKPVFKELEGGGPINIMN